MTQPEVKVEVVELADSAVILRAWLWAADQTDATALKFALNRSVKTDLTRKILNLRTLTSQLQSDGKAVIPLWKAPKQGFFCQI